MLLRKIKHTVQMKFFAFALRLMPGNSHQLFSGEGSSAQLCQHMARMGLKKVLIVSDKPLVELGVVNKATQAFGNLGVETVLFDEVQPDPVFSTTQRGAHCFKENNCDAILAIGGGSSIDAAKTIGVVHTHDGTLKDLTGLGSVKMERLPPLYVIPTTSGTGSEATRGAVISDDESHEKFIVSTGNPAAACIDPELLLGMPPAITAMTGLDALTHAVEAYLNTWKNDGAKALAATAVQLIFDTLPTAYKEGGNISARDSMAHAAYLAGRAINENGVGNVHAIAHQLGAIYGIPHGLANAIVMPYVLNYYVDDAREGMTKLAKLIGKNTAEEFVEALRELNNELGIGTGHEKIEEKDFDEITARAIAESNGYPSPRLLTEDEVRTMLQKMTA